MMDGNTMAKPLDALNRSRGKRVIVDLKNGWRYVGKLQAFDIHINTVLDEAEEIKEGEIVRKIGSVVVRGDNVVYVSP